MSKVVAFISVDDGAGNADLSLTDTRTSTTGVIITGYDVVSAKPA